MIVFSKVWFKKYANYKSPRGALLPAKKIPWLEEVLRWASSCSCMTESKVWAYTLNKCFRIALTTNMKHKLTLWFSTCLMYTTIWSELLRGFWKCCSISHTDFISDTEEVISHASPALLWVICLNFSLCRERIYARPFPQGVCSYTSDTCLCDMADKHTRFQ